MKPNALRLKVPTAIFTIAAVIAVALFVVSCGTTLFDNDRFGKVGVPGEATLDLESPGTVISYEDRVSLPSDTSIDAPEDLRISVRSAGTGEPVKLEKESNLHSYNYNDLHGTSVARAFIPEDGEYRVAVRRERGGGGSEAITFGPDLSVGKLLKRSGLIVGAGLALALLVGIVGLVIGRMRGEPPGLNPKTPPKVAPAGAVAAGSPVTASPAPGAPAPPSVPAAPQPPAPDASDDPASQLAALDDTRTRENLSDEEYETRRKRIIEGI